MHWHWTYGLTMYKEFEDGREYAMGAMTAPGSTEEKARRRVLNHLHDNGVMVKQIELIGRENPPGVGEK